MNTGFHTPLCINFKKIKNQKDAGITWSHRFNECRGKLLRELGHARIDKEIKRYKEIKEKSMTQHQGARNMRKMLLADMTPGGGGLIALLR